MLLLSKRSTEVTFKNSMRIQIPDPGSLPIIRNHVDPDPHHWVRHNWAWLFVIVGVYYIGGGAGAGT